MNSDQYMKIKNKIFELKKRPVVVPLILLALAVGAISVGGCGRQDDSSSPPRKAQKASKDLQYKSGKQDDAASLLKKAEAGNMEAQYKLGVLLAQKAKSEGSSAGANLLSGSIDKGVEGFATAAQIDSKSSEWFEKAATQGHPDAQLILGIRRLGQQYYNEGVNWLTRASECSNSVSQRAAAHCWLGWCYKKGRGVSQNYEEALRLYTLSSEEGCLDAAYELASAYYDGKIASRDVQKAAHFFRLYVSKVAATNVLYNILAYYPDDSPADDLEEKKGQSALILGDICAAGEGSLNMEEAAKWWQIAAENGGNADAAKKLRSYKAGQGDAESQYQMAYDCWSVMHEGSPRIKKEELKKWVLLSAKQGHTKAQLDIGTRYKELFSRQERVTWLRAAAEQGDEDAQYELGKALCSNEKTGSPEDLQDRMEAYAWMNLVATCNAFDRAVARSTRDEILSEMPPEQVKEAQRISLVYIEKYAKKRP